MEYFELNNRELIPAIGFGAGTVKPLLPLHIYYKRLITEKVKNIVIKNYIESNRYPVARDRKKTLTFKKNIIHAYETGYLLFDTARAYQYSERIIGEALSGINRNGLYLITKITNDAQTKHSIRECFSESLRELNTDYVDLLLLHWPQTGTYIEAYKELEKIYLERKARAIGVCNCHINHLEEIKNRCSIIPAVNELECHPLLQQHEVRDYCRSNDIQIIAHTPTGRMDSKIIIGVKPIADAHQVSPSQVILRWHYQLGDIAIPNSTSYKHLEANFDIFSFQLSKDEMNQIKSLDCGKRFWPDPDCCDFTKL